MNPYDFRYGHWVSEFPVDDEVEFGFIYLITNLTNDRKYIGKKQFWKYRKGKKWKKFSWQDYTSSSKELNLDIAKLGKDSFEFRILYPVCSRGTARYFETNEQHVRDVLVAKLPSGEREYYNKTIDGVKFLPKLEASEETKRKISQSGLGIKRNLSGLEKDWSSSKGKQRRTNHMKKLNEAGLAYTPAPRKHRVKLRNGEEFVVNDWVKWAVENGYKKDSLIMLRRGKSKSSRKNGVKSEEDVVYFQSEE